MWSSSYEPAVGSVVGEGVSGFDESVGGRWFPGTDGSSGAEAVEGDSADMADPRCALTRASCRLLFSSSAILHISHRVNRLNSLPAQWNTHTVCPMRVWRGTLPWLLVAGCGRFGVALSPGEKRARVLQIRRERQLAVRPYPSRFRFLP